MKCPTCQAEMICRIGDHHYRESGLDNVYLIGITICECNCGEKVVSIPSVVELQKKLGLEFLKKKSLLDAEEIRFLRKNMGLTAKKLADIIGVDNATISRWEKGKQPINKTNDRLLRLIYSNIKGIPEDKIKNLIEQDFTQILSEKAEEALYRIPIQEWSKTDLCFVNE